MQKDGLTTTGTGDVQLTIEDVIKRQNLLEQSLDSGAVPTAAVSRLNQQVASVITNIVSEHDVVPRGFGATPHTNDGSSNTKNADSNLSSKPRRRDVSAAGDNVPVLNKCGSVPAGHSATLSSTTSASEKSSVSANGDAAVRGGSVAPSANGNSPDAKLDDKKDPELKNFVEFLRLRYPVHFLEKQDGEHIESLAATYGAAKDREKKLPGDQRSPIPQAPDYTPRRCEVCETKFACTFTYEAHIERCAYLVSKRLSVDADPKWPEKAINHMFKNVSDLATWCYIATLSALIFTNAIVLSIQFNTVSDAPTRVLEPVPPFPASIISFASVLTALWAGSMQVQVSSRTLRWYHSLFVSAPFGLTAYILIQAAMPFAHARSVIILQFLTILVMAVVVTSLTAHPHLAVMSVHFACKCTVRRLIQTGCVVFVILYGLFTLAILQSVNIVFPLLGQQDGTQCSDSYIFLNTTDKLAVDTACDNREWWLTFAVSAMALVIGVGLSIAIPLAISAVRHRTELHTWRDVDRALAAKAFR